MKFALTTLIAALLLAIAGPLTEARFASIKVSLAMTVADDSHRLSEDMVRICAQETDLSMDELTKFRQNDFTNSSEATQCFTHCIYEQMGLVRDGVFVERDAIATLADVTDPKQLTQSDCMGIRGANKCETAFKIYQCHQEHRMRGLPKEPPLMAKNLEGGHGAKPNSNNNNNYNNNNNNGNNYKRNGYNQDAEMDN